MNSTVADEEAPPSATTEFSQAFSAFSVDDFPSEGFILFVFGEVADPEMVDTRSRKFVSAFDSEDSASPLYWGKIRAIETTLTVQGHHLLLVDISADLQEECRGEVAHINRYLANKPGISVGALVFPDGEKAAIESNISLFDFHKKWPFVFVRHPNATSSNVQSLRRQWERWLRKCVIVDALPTGSRRSAIELLRRRFNVEGGETHSSTPSSVLSATTCSHIRPGGGSQFRASMPRPLTAKTSSSTLEARTPTKRVQSSPFRPPSAVESWLNQLPATEQDAHPSPPSTIVLDHLYLLPYLLPEGVTQTPTTEVPPTPVGNDLERPTCDLLFVVIGMTGSGKSQFISQAIGADVGVNHNLGSACSQEITSWPCLNFAATETVLGQSSRVALVDTPGFNSTYDESGDGDKKILHDILAWLQKAIRDGNRVAGFIYLNRKGRKAYLVEEFEDTFEGLCGGRREFRSKVALVTTHCDEYTAEHDDDIESIYDERWKSMIKGGAIMKRSSGGGPILSPKPDRQTIEILEELVKRAREAMVRQEKKLKRVANWSDDAKSVWSWLDDIKEDDPASVTARTLHGEMKQQYMDLQRRLELYQKLLSDACVRNDERSADRVVEDVKGLHRELARKYADIVRKRDKQCAPGLKKRLKKEVDGFLQKINASV